MLTARGGIAVPSARPGLAGHKAYQAIVARRSRPAPAARLAPRAIAALSARPARLARRRSDVNYEVDDGTDWALSNMPLALANTNAGYEDAGVVVDLGPASSFNGYSVSGTGPLVKNLWITDGSEAFTPGEHSLSGTPDFSFFTANNDGTWAAQDAKASAYGQNATNDDIATGYAGYEVYAWVGVTNDGTTGRTGHINSVNGTPVNADVKVGRSTASAR